MKSGVPWQAPLFISGSGGCDNIARLPDLEAAEFRYWCWFRRLAASDLQGELAIWERTGSVIVPTDRPFAIVDNFARMR